MPKDNQNDPTRLFAPRWLPWILGLAMLVFYCLTLNRWVTLANLLPVAKVSGFLWQPDFFNPILYLVTLPFRWLPASKVPLALNLFSALCAAITLGLLARSVAILPQDRTEMQRSRERSDFGFLTIPSAWFPPALAVAMFGLQFGFWQHATSFTGEMVNMLIFSAIIWLLLEFRLDERPVRLLLAALLYGAGMADNWALIGFLPVFIAAIIWLKKLEFFNVRFLVGMFVSGLAGLLMYLVLPVIYKLSGDMQLGFWEMLKPALRADWQIIKLIKVGEIRHNLLLMSVTTFLPVLLMAIRWRSDFGDASAIGRQLINYLFHLINAVVFGACVWIMFDPPFSPGQLAQGTPALTFYYLAALAIGYFAGYYILIFGRKGVPSRRYPRPLPALPGAFNALSPLIYWATYATAFITLGALFYKNLPPIRALNDNTLLRYAELTEQSLPSGGGILLSDPEVFTSSQVSRTLLTQAVLARDGRDKDYLVVDTQMLNWAPYHRFLHKKAPQKWPLLVGEKDMGGISLMGLLGLMHNLVQSNNVCYLNPSFGYYFEFFYLEPRGLVYNVKSLPETTLLPPPLTTNLIAENQKFWASAAESEFPRLEQAQTAAKSTGRIKLFDWVVMKLHGQADPNPNANFASSLYSRSLNYWGVELQRAGRLTDAAECFANAQKINPDNVAAGYNLEFNQRLQAGTATNIVINPVTPDQFGKYRSWSGVLNACGPFDEPSFCYNIGYGMLNNTLNDYPLPLQRQAIQAYDRIRQLIPNDLSIRLTLAQLYLMNRLPDTALATLDDAIKDPARFGLNPSNSTPLNVTVAAACFQKNDVAEGIKVLDREIARHPDDAALLTTATQSYFMRGLYSNALNVINGRLARTPDDPQWLFGKGYAYLQMTNYDKAITAFTRVLDLSTNDNSARFNRGLAYLQSGRLDEARADYTLLQSVYTNAYQVAYCLGEVAWKQHDTNEAIRNYQIFLDNAPTNSGEIPEIRERLNSLKR